MTADPNQSDSHVEANEPQSGDLVPRVLDAIRDGDADKVRTLTTDLLVPDLADVIELLPPEDRVGLILALGPAFDFEVHGNSAVQAYEEALKLDPQNIVARSGKTSVTEQGLRHEWFQGCLYINPDNLARDRSRIGARNEDPATVIHSA